MSRRNLFLLTGLLVFVSLIYFILQRSARPPGVTEALWVRLGKDSWKEVDRWEVFWGGNQTQKLVFRRLDGEWQIKTGDKDYPLPARASSVEDFLGDLSQLVGEERAAQKELWPRFALTPDQALHLKGYQGSQEVFYLYVGKRGPAWETNFIRVKSSPKVYLVYQNLLSRFEIWKEKPAAPSVKPWVDLEIWSAPLADLKELAFYWQGKRLWQLKKTAEGWKILKKTSESPFPKAEEKLRALFPLVAQEVVAPKAFSQEKGRLEIKTAYKEVTLLVAPGPKEGYLVKVSGKPYVYAVEKALLEKLRQF